MKSDLIGVIRQMQNKRILVIGDMVADVYLNGKISRISREAPVLVLEQAEEKIVAGGAANVAHNAATLGGRVYAVGLLGGDGAGSGLEAILAGRGADTSGLFVDERRPTITKTRIIAGGAATVSQQIVRIDKEDKSPVSASLEAKVMKRLETLLPEIDGVVLSDYGGALLTESVVKMLLYHCRRQNIPSIVDSRYRIKDFTGVDYIKQNDAEVAAIVGFELENEELLLKAGAMLLKQMRAKGILITRGSRGMTLFEANGAVHDIPVSNCSEVFDVSGAGDTCVAAMILALSAGVEPVLAAELSNFASGIAVRKLGTATVTSGELEEAIGAYQYGHS